MTRLLRNLTLGVVCSFLGLWLACDSATPTAPTGTILTISANPSQIGLNGTSNITVIGRRPDGNPLNPGTEIFFSSSIGTVTPAVVAVDDDGIARATLRGDGRVGTATVTASVSVTSSGGGGGGGDGEGGAGPTTGVGSASVEVTVGKAAGSVSLQATPTSLPEEFGIPDNTNESRQIQLLALVRDDQGQPLPEASVNFSTEVGSLQSGGAFLTTNTRGEARDTLVVTEGDLNTVSGDTFSVTAEAASGSAELRSDEATVSILRKPVAGFTFDINQFTVAFQDTSTGNPTSWRWTFGDGTQVNTSQNPTHTYPATNKTYTVTLTVTNAAGSSEISQLVTVPRN